MAKKRVFQDRSSVIRADPNFANAIKELKMKRMQMGRDPLLKPVKTSRITLAMMRHPNFNKIMNDILGADLK